jgi:hypothetical protein
MFHEIFFCRIKDMVWNNTDYEKVLKSYLCENFHKII